MAEVLLGFSVAFFTQGEHLVPVVRRLEPHMTIILSPGRVWSEPGDGGLSRASFPFVLTNPHSNVTYNGLATFIYDDTRVSASRFQVVQETAAWAKFDGWGQTPLTYAPGPLANETVVWEQFAAELQRQTPIRPWSVSPAATGSPWLEGFNGDAAPDEVSASGLIVDGVIYLRGCQTRWGPSPYCQHMRHGVFSVTKSLGAAVALLRLAQPLTASDLRAEVPGHTFYRDHVTSFPAVFGGQLSMSVWADGLLYGTFTRRPDDGMEHDVGRWQITPEGQFCRTWHVWDHRRERCYALSVSLPIMYRGGETFEFVVTDRWDTELHRRVPGNPEGY